MVSPNDATVGSNVSTVSTVSTPTFNRGFIPEETVVASGPGAAQITYYRPFWRPVLAGTLVTLSMFVLSWYLMLGCHVGLDNDGTLNLGAGSALWLCVTACVAYFVGGLIANAMTSMPSDSVNGAIGVPYGNASLKGLVIWGLSIPLALVIYSFISQSAPHLLGGLLLPHAGIVPSENGPNNAPHLGFFWSMFIGLALGLTFAIIGSISASIMARSDFDLTTRNRT